MKESIEIGVIDLRERDDLLKKMGFHDYGEYLNSDLWELVKLRLRERPESKACRVCGSTTGLVWHHVCYTLPVLVGNFSNSSMPVIVRLCSVCHRGVHYHDGNFQSTETSYSRLNEMIRLGNEWVRLEHKLPHGDQNLDREGF